MQQYKGIFASSQDPTGQTLSLTIESFSKVLIGVITWLAVSKGFDPASAATQTQAIIDTIAQGLPLAFSLWHACLTLWGLVRKLFAMIFTVQTPQ